MAGTNGTWRISRLPAAAVDGGPHPEPRRPRLITPFSFVVTASRYVLAAVFLAAAITKITDLRSFADYLVVHSGFPSHLALVLATVLPWLELVCAACLLFGRAVRESAAILCVLLTLFVCYSLLHWHEPDCGCFLFPGTRSPVASGWILARDLLLLLAGLTITCHGTSSQ
jgi:putative oxidoreductase